MDTIPEFRTMLKEKNVLLGVTGGIAAYKASYIVRELKRLGADVRVIMTHSATQFITPLTMSTLSQHEVIVSLWPKSTHESTDLGVQHIDIGLWADIMLILPATANTIAKLATGIADNALTSTALSVRCPLVVAPAMDLDMYRHPATQHNLGILSERGCSIIEPESGELASGLSGPGRLPELKPVIEKLEEVLAGSRKDLRGVSILITAGPTYEKIDPVRFIGNRSSGKMGFAIAKSAALRGAEVTLITGPTSCVTPAGVKRINVESAAEMFEAVAREHEKHRVIIMAAAVSDFRPVKAVDRKLKKADDGAVPQLMLEQTEDILRYVGERKNSRILIGFALETENELSNAREKLNRKNLDYIVVNNPKKEGSAFGSDTNQISIIDKSGDVQEFPLMSKFEAAHKILDRIHGR
jgi:phosphopantothenoylcysteine decarboxylase / phosphopantothenate---cysteine ligase